MQQISLLTIVGVLSFSLSGVLSKSQPEPIPAKSSTYAVDAEPPKTRAGKTRRPTPEGRRYRTRATLAADNKTTEHTETPLARVYQHLLQLRRQHADLIDAGEVKNAKKLHRRISQFERSFRYPVPASPGTDPRAHAIGIYSVRDKPVRVRVTDSSAPVVLVLTAYSTACWIVEADIGVQIDLVICTGYHNQTVERLPPGVPVFSTCYDDRSKDYAYAYGPDRAKWGELEEFVRKWTGGMEISTVAGGYYSAQESYVVGPENADWRVQMLDREVQ